MRTTRLITVCYLIALVCVALVQLLSAFALNATAKSSSRNSLFASPHQPIPPFTPPAISPSRRLRVSQSLPPHAPAPPRAEYLWYEAENMRGISSDKRGEPVLSPSFLNLPKAKAPGWCMNGPGVSAEWTQGGESEWNSVAAAADETRATISQEVEVPRAGDYKIWVRYADWANKSEPFVIRITQGSKAADLTREVLHQEFGTREVIDQHDEVSMYWGWAFAWDGVRVALDKGPARISIEIEKAGDARRNVDAVLLTNDPAYMPEGRRKPDFAATSYLRELSKAPAPLSPLAESVSSSRIPAAWQRPKIAGRDFLMPWNISRTSGTSTTSPQTNVRFIRSMPNLPISSSLSTRELRRCRCSIPNFVVPVIYINNLPEYLKEGSPFLRYLRETKTPFAVLINYGSAKMSDGGGQGRMETFDWRIQGSVSGLDFRRECRLCLGHRRHESENHAVDVAAGTARSASQFFIPTRIARKVGGDFSY